MTKGHKFNKQYLPYGSTPDSDLLHFIMSHDTLTNKIGLSKIGVIHAKSCVHLAWNVPIALLRMSLDMAAGPCECVFLCGVCVCLCV